MTASGDDLHRLEATDGLAVTYRRWLPTDPAWCVVQIVHGAAEHSGRYAPFAHALARAGMAVYGLDLRGHGVTAQSTGTGQLASRHPWIVSLDVMQLDELLRTTHPTLPRVLFGQGMGALMALAAAEQMRSPEGLVGLALAGPGVHPYPSQPGARVTWPALRDRSEVLVPPPTDLNLPFLPARTPYDWRSRDLDEVDAFLADPLCGAGFALSEAYLQALDHVEREVVQGWSLAGLPQGLRVLLLTGQEDHAARAFVGPLLAGILPWVAAELLERRTYPEARHDLLHEINRSEVVADLLDWLGRLRG